MISVVCPNCRSRLTAKETPDVQDKLITCPICSYKAKVSDFLPAQEAKKSNEPSGGAGQQTRVCPNPACRYETNNMRALFCRKCGTRLPAPPTEMHEKLPEKLTQNKFKAPEQQITPPPVPQHLMNMPQTPEQPLSPPEIPDCPVNNDTGQMRIVQTGQICELRLGSQVLGRLAQTGTADLQIGGDGYRDEYMSRRHVQIDVVRTERGIEHRLVEIGSKNIIKLNDKDINRGDEIVLKFGDKLTLGKTDVILEETNEDATRII